MSLVTGSSDVLQLLSQAGPNLFIVNINKGPNPFNIKSPQWTVDQVAQKLAQYGVNRDDLRLLARQDVDGEVLAYLTEDSLMKIGIQTLGRRIKILKAIQAVLAPYTVGTDSSAQSSQQLTTTSSNRPSSSARPQSSNNFRQSLNNDSEEDENEDIDNPYNRNNNQNMNRRSNNNNNDRFSSTAPSSYQNNFATTDEDSAEDEDIEREREYIRPAQKRLEAKSNLRSSAAGIGGDDDLFGTEEAGEGQQFMAVKPWIGQIVAPSKPPQNNPNPPDRHLRLEWAYGYRAFDSRSNLFYNSVGDIVYPVAGIVVVYNSKQKKQRHFLGHNDDVRCLTRHPKNLNLFASGQNASIVQGRSIAPYICVWDSTQFDKLIVLKGVNTDRAIRCVCFSGDGKYLASVSNDDNHTIKIWDWEKKTLLTSVKGSNYPIYAIQGNHVNTAEFVSVGKRHAVSWAFDGVKLSGKKLSTTSSSSSKTEVTFYNVCFSEKGYTCLGGDDGQVHIFSGGKLMKAYLVHPQAKITSLHWYFGGIVTGGTDNQVCILDKKLNIAKKFRFQNKINSVHVNGDNLLIGTQGSEVFEIVDYMNTDIDSDQKLDPITRGHSDGELWAIAILPDSRTFITAGEDNSVAIWDLLSHKMIKKAIISEKRGKAPKIQKASTTSSYPPNQCARAIAIDPKGKHIIVGLNNGCITVFDTRTMNRLIDQMDLNKYGQRKVDNQTGNWIQVIAYNPAGTICAVGTHGSVIVLLDVLDGYKVKAELKASQSYITHLDWSIDGSHLQSNDGAYELLFYDIDEQNLKNSRQNTKATSLKDVKWATQTCCFGWPVQGIFDPSQDGSDINTCDSNQNKTLIATGDDNGNVNLFRYPVMKGNKSTSSHAHSSHVVRVRFTPDDRYILSTGGHDLSVMQWQVV